MTICIYIYTVHLIITSSAAEANAIIATGFHPAHKFKQKNANFKIVYTHVFVIIRHKSPERKEHTYIYISSIYIYI